MRSNKARNPGIRIIDGGPPLESKPNTAKIKSLNLNSYSKKSEIDITTRAGDIEKFFTSMSTEELESLVYRCNRAIAARRE